MGREIVIGGERVSIIDAPVTGDISITEDSVSTIGAGKITVGMIESNLLADLLPAGEIDVGRIDYCVIE